MAEIRNPNAGGSPSQGNSSFTVTMLIMLVVVFGLQYFRAKQQKTEPAPAKPAATTPAQAPAATAAATNTPETPRVAAAAESTTTVENELYRITFSNRGGQVTSWVLKRYKDTTGAPLDLVHTGASRLYGFPLSLYTYDPQLTAQLANALYVPSATGSLQSPATLSFKYSGEGLDVTKTFTFGADYVIHADTEVKRNGVDVAALISWPAALGDMESTQLYASAMLDKSSNNHDEHLEPKKVVGGDTLHQSLDFIGTSDQYFAAIFMPDRPATATAVTLSRPIDLFTTKRNDKAAPPSGVKKSVTIPALGSAVGDAGGHVQASLFVGPKAIDVLKNVHTASGGTLSPVLDFGFWGYIGKFLFLGIRAVHSWIAHGDASTGNYSWGWSIVLFTILLNLVLLPLRVQGMKSAIAMQRIQPKIDAIKAKHKNPGPTDPRAAEMNAEIMEMQKKEGVNMFGGCIPMLIQLPLLFAFFTMMTRVVELRQAHFFWLPDLSVADPLHILPITMLITSFLVQFYSPSPGVDPAQQRMMAIMMPLMSVFFTWNYASGLALYWNIGNLVMLIQQLVMNQTSLGKEMRAIAAERARKLTAQRSQAVPQQRREPPTIQGRR